MSNLLKEEDTIAAIATPTGTGGIGVIRISGPASPDILSRLFRPKNPLPRLEPRRLHYGWAIDPADGAPIDEILAVFIKGPASYTKEDMAELQCHGGHAVLKRLLEAVTSCGARLAEPGEFTKRAFVNGRIDLAQAEAVLELIQAKTEKERCLAMTALDGRLKDRIEPARQAVIQALARIEAAIDFPDEGLEPIDGEAVAGQLLDNAIFPIKDIVDSYNQRRILREGARVALAGRPNAGKSSLFNAMLGACRVIVSPTPGTTRDTVEETLDLDGISVTIVDTAGINAESHDPVEAMGMEFSVNEIRRADVVIMVSDISNGLSAQDSDLLEMVPDKTPVIMVLNKADLVHPSERGRIEKIMQDRLPHRDHGVSLVTASASNGPGLDELKKEIIRLAVPQDGNGPAHAISEFVPNLRQKNAAQQALAALEQACGGLKKRLPQELVAVDLNDALKKLDEILGIETGPEIFDEIFSRFCIGK
ncbi:MAG: tRNA uridine-5-carboxymethylaminomethyl(34) synthesis GTPase MnmE [Desulfobacteraceae bacterium]|nr:tRNA uridine-5-carboxymethylaminomethyl(34) synthesis GTPase MnmE [Desulfobacteraceae bacterium]